jgi:hypothetical protein
MYKWWLPNLCGLQFPHLKSRKNNTCLTEIL